MNNLEYLKKQGSVTLNLFLSGRYLQVINKCKTLTKAFPNQVIFFNIFALSYANLGRNIEGLKILNKGLELNPNNILLLNNIGLLNMNLNNRKLAREYFDKVLSYNENFVDALVNKAHLELKDNNTYKAEKLFLRSTSLATTNQQKEIINIGLAQLYQQIGNFKKSIELFKHVLKFNPFNTMAHKSISVMYKYNDKNEEHLKTMESLLKKTDNEELLQSLYYALGKAYEDLKFYEKSFDFINKGNKISNKKANYFFKDDQILFDKIKIFFKNFKKENNSNHEDNLIFIVGMPRSGTSLTEQIISAHSSVFGAGELPFIEKNIREHLLINNNFLYHSVNLVDSEIFMKMKKNYLNEIMSFDTKKKITIDKAPLNFIWIGFIKCIFPNSKIIHCRRDPMDTCFSNYKNSFGDKSLGFSYNLENLGRFYNLYRDLMNFWETIFANDIYHLDYEKLINNQKEETKKLIKFCNLEWQDSCLLPHKNKNKVATASVAQIREPVYKSSVYKWKNYSKFLEDLKKIIYN